MAIKVRLLATRAWGPVAGDARPRSNGPCASAQYEEHAIMSLTRLLSLAAYRRSAHAVFAVGAILFGQTLGAAAADQPAWTVTQVSGEVRHADGASPSRPATVGLTLAPGHKIETGAEGRAVLERGGDSITLSAASEVQVPEPRPNAPTVVQRLGTALFSVMKRTESTFNVETPFLAAVVKGTTFTVTVNREGAAVHVTQGAVEVASRFSGQTELVRPGMTATVPAAPSAPMRVIGGERRSERLAPAATAVKQAAVPSGGNTGSDSKAAGGDGKPVSAPVADKDGAQQQVRTLAKISDPVQARPASISALSKGLIAVSEPRLQLGGTSGTASATGTSRDSSGSTAGSGTTSSSTASGGIAGGGPAVSSTEGSSSSGGSSSGGSSSGGGSSGGGSSGGGSGSGGSGSGGSGSGGSGGSSSGSSGSGGGGSVAVTSGGGSSGSSKIGSGKKK